MADNALRDEILRLAVPRVTGDFSDVEIIAHILDAMAFMIAMLPELTSQGDDLRSHLGPADPRRTEGGQDRDALLAPVRHGA